MAGFDSLRGPAKLFWGIFGSCAVLVGLYAAAKDLKHVYYFWLCLAVAIIGTLAISLSRRLPMWVKSIRGYPTLLGQVASLEKRNDELRKILESTSNATLTRWKEGFQAGRDQVSGAIAARNYSLPQLCAVSFSGGALLLYADYDPGSQPEVGARYAMQVKKTLEVRGVVEIRGVSTEVGQVTLECVSIDSTSFWQHLSDRAQYDSAAPSDVELAYLDLDYLPALDPATGNAI